MTKVDSTRSAFMFVCGLSLMACDAGAGSDSSADPSTSGTPSSASPGAADGTTGAPAPQTASPAAEVPVAALRNVHGSLTDQGGGSPAVGLGGAGSLSAAASVQITALLSGGVQSVIAHVPLAADGTFSADIGADVKLAIADALDLKGNVVGSVLVAIGADAGAQVLLAPITTHTSLICEALRTLLGCNSDVPDVGGLSEGPVHGGSLAPFVVDLNLALDVDVAASVAAALAHGVDVHALIKGLAGATLAAHNARFDALAQAGVSIDAGALVAADLDVLADLQAGLAAIAAGTSTSLTVTKQLHAGIDAALGLGGAVAGDVRVRADASASLALDAFLDASLGGLGKTSVDVGKACTGVLTNSIGLEAKAAADAAVSLLVAAGAPEATVDASIAAGATLVANVLGAVDVKAAADARQKFVDALTGVGGGAGILAGLGVGVDSLIGLSVGSLAGLTADLDAALSVDLNLHGSVDLCAGTIDVSAGASVDAGLSGVIDTLISFCDDVKKASGRMDAPGVTGNVDVIAKILASAQLVARVSI